MKETSVIADELYFLVSQKLDKNSRKFKQMIGNFINTRHKELYATAPYDRIFFKNYIRLSPPSVSGNEIEFSWDTKETSKDNIITILIWS